jgi:hypothetical protein
MPTFNNGEIGSGVRTKINTAITTVDSLNTGDNLLLTAAERAKLAGVEAGATADQTPAEIAALVQDWRGVGNETLISATVALESAASSGTPDGNRGDVTVSGGGTTWTVNNNVITNAKQATMADSTIKGRATGAGSGNPTDLTPTQVRTIINVEDGATADQTPAEIASMQQNWRGVGVETLIAATAALQSAASSGVADGDKGDVTVTSSGNTWTIDNNTVTNAKAADMAALSVKANPANSVSDPTDLQATADGHVLTRSGTSLVFGTVQTAGVANSAVTNAKLAPVNQNTFKGRISAGAGSPEDLTPAQARTMLNVAEGANNYAHPNHTGDVTSVADGATTIANNAVTNVKLADMAANTVKVRAANTSGDPSDLALNTSELVGRGSTGNITAVTLGAGLAMTDAVLSVGAAISATKTTPVDADSVPIFNSEASNATVTTTVGGLRTRLSNKIVETGLPTTGGINLDFALLSGRTVSIALTGNPTFTTTNRAAGRHFELRLSAGASARTIVWPAGWIAFGAALPTSLAAGATLRVAIECLGADDSNVDASWIVSV